MQQIEDLQELRARMIFQGYNSRNLDAISMKYQERFNLLPLAFLARSPFGITGSIENKKNLVVSKKHGAANTILVSTLLNRGELENTILALGETSQKIYVARHKAIELQQKKEEAQISNYEKHCTYCGKKYIVDINISKPTCGAASCIIKHKEYLGMKREIQSSNPPKQQESVTKETPLPEFSLDDPSHNTLQGYIYCVRAVNGLCKIGRSSNPEERFSSLITMSPVDLFLEHTVFSDNYVLAEAFLHDELKAYRHHGEWFDLPDSIYNWIMSLDNYDLDTPASN